MAPMDPALASALARATLYFHFLVVVFNISALILIPLGTFLDWGFIRIFWWRALHVASMALVAVQAALGQYCFLTLLQNRFQAGAEPGPDFWLDEWVTRAIYWPLPFETFVVLYVIALGLTLLFWIWARPGKPFRARDPL
ncbi:MAG: hypothetical protein RJB62_1850 [Pseudomonadota bacterium]